MKGLQEQFIKDTWTITRWGVETGEGGGEGLGGGEGWREKAENCT